MPTADLAHPERCLAANLRRAVRAANQFYDGFIAVPDGQATQFTLLATINGFGRCSQGELAAWLGADPTTITRGIALLKKAGLVRSTPGEQDRRLRMVELTAEGRLRLERLLPQWRAAQEAALAAFGSAKARQLLTLLDEFTAATTPGLR